MIDSKPSILYKKQPRRVTNTSTTQSPPKEAQPTPKKPKNSGWKKTTKTPQKTDSEELADLTAGEEYSDSTLKAEIEKDLLHMTSKMKSFVEGFKDSIKSDIKVKPDSEAIDGLNDTYGGLLSARVWTKSTKSKTKGKRRLRRN